MSSELTKLPSWNELVKLYPGGNVPMPFQRHIFLMECRVAGTTYIENIGRRLRGLAAGSTVRLVREPENPCDALAIRVENPSGEKLGYIPRASNAVLARLLDAGKNIYGKLSQAPDEVEDGWVIIPLAIFLYDL